MILPIKNMVCNRCISAVESILTEHKIAFEEVKLGEASVRENLSPKQLQELNFALQQQGFEILTSQNQQFIEKMKNLLIAKIQNLEVEENFVLSHFLSHSLSREYSALSKLFSQVEGITAEQFFLRQKIEKAKELLTYQELTLSEIADKLGYSSVQHLSTQFRKITGLSPSAFQKLREKPRKNLDNI